jgi:F0F1-type ATP synthase assembly protein I
MKDKARADALADGFLREARKKRMKAAQRRNKLWKSGVSKWRVVGILFGLTMGWLLGLWLNNFEVTLLVSGVIVGAILGAIADTGLRKNNVRGH